MHYLDIATDNKVLLFRFFQLGLLLSLLATCLQWSSNSVDKCTLKLFQIRGVHLLLLDLTTAALESKWEELAFQTASCYDNEHMLLGNPGLDTEAVELHHHGNTCNKTSKFK
jgi:hypothetical protein